VNRGVLEYSFLVYLRFTFSERWEIIEKQKDKMSRPKRKEFLAADVFVSSPVVAKKREFLAGDLFASSPVRASEKVKQEKTPVRASEKVKQEKTPVRASEKVKQEKTPVRASEKVKQEKIFEEITSIDVAETLRKDAIDAKRCANTQISVTYTTSGTTNTGNAKST
jgi:hypothetical protein